MNTSDKDTPHREPCAVRPENMVWYPCALDDGWEEAELERVVDCICPGSVTLATQDEILVHDGVDGCLLFLRGQLDDPLRLALPGVIQTATVKPARKPSKTKQQDQLPLF